MLDSMHIHDLGKFGHFLHNFLIPHTMDITCQAGMNKTTIE